MPAEGESEFSGQPSVQYKKGIVTCLYYFFTSFLFLKFLICTQVSMLFCACVRVGWEGAGLFMGGGGHYFHLSNIILVLVVVELCFLNLI